MLSYNNEKIYSSLNIPVDERTNDTSITMRLLDHVNKLGLDGYRIISYSSYNDRMHWSLSFQFEIEKQNGSSDNIE